MSLDVWFKDDIKHMIDSVTFTFMQAVGRMPQSEVTAAYAEGHRDAIMSIARAFGLDTSIKVEKIPALEGKYRWQCPSCDKWNSGDECSCGAKRP